MSSCSPYICGVGACKITCATDSDCLAPYTCQGTAGAMSCALKKNGLACTTGGQCISGNCVDGVCCGSASCAPCQACNLSGTGSCSAVAAGTPAPSAFCSDQGATSCGTNGNCDGQGGCQTYPNGTACSSATCPANASTLTMAGTCQGGNCSKPTSSCTPYFCNGVNACQGTCGSDTDCQAGYYCTGAGGNCLAKKTMGTACTAGDQCQTGNCVDGYCCGTASCPSCQACNVQGMAGTCSPMGAGAVDANGSCVDQGASSCGTNGKCDGSGGCQKYPNGTTCSQATCQSSATLKLAGQCSAGTCVASTQMCAPYLCNSNACANACNTDMDCASGTYCSGPGGTCVAKKMNGQACSPSAPNQCAFGNCVDGVCCDTACTGACLSCATGTCTPTLANMADPHGICTDQHAASCGTDGLCDGMGGCQIYAPATVCSAEICTVGTSTHTKPGTCATGTCSATTENCDPYMCGSNNQCLGGCTDDTSCVPGNYCSGGSCVATKALGATCSANDQCGTGNCVENVCCGTANCAECQSCALPNHQGTCTQVDPGTVDPSGTCKNQGSIGCGTTGTCDSAGKCAFQPGSVMCAAASCSGTDLLSAQFCDGAGNCAPGTATHCSPFTCDPSGPACFASCADSTSCDTPSYMCDTTVPPGQCVPTTP
jgi:hypothetical protein